MGRQSKFEKPMVKLPVQLTERHIEMARFIGKGNVSKGIRLTVFRSEGYEWTKWDCVLRSLTKQGLCVIGYSVPRRRKIGISIPGWVIEHFKHYIDFFEEKITENNNKSINEFISRNRTNALSKIIMYCLEEYKLDYHCCFNPDIELDELNSLREKIFLVENKNIYNWWELDNSI